MSFNGSGTYVLPTGQPAVTGTIISATTFNNYTADVGNTFNNCLPRDGQASMSAPLKLQDGTSTAPGISFNSESSTGILRPTTGVLSVTVLGAEVMRAVSGSRVLVGTTTDDGTTRLQVSGTVSATSFVGPLTGNASTATSATSASSATTATNATNLANTGAVATNGSFYPTFVASNSSTNQAHNTAAGLSFNPSSGVLSATSFTGAGTGLTGTAGSLNIGGNSATTTLATKASTLAQGGGSGTAMTFNWSGQAGQPSWVWGGTDGVNHYVYNPSNFNVNSATTAGSASSASSATTASTVTHSPSRTDASAYPVAWVSGTPSQLYSCAAVTITSSTGTLSASNLYSSGDITGFSDARIKTDIQVIPDALAKVRAMRGVTFTRTDEAHKGLRQAGVIAQEVQKVMSEFVKENEAGMLSVAYGNMVSVLIEAVKELAERLESLEGK